MVVLNAALMSLLSTKTFPSTWIVKNSHVKVDLAVPWFWDEAWWSADDMPTSMNIAYLCISPFAEISRADSRCEQAIGMEVTLAGEMLHSSLVTCETCKVVPKKGCESQERWIVPGMIWVLHCPNSAKVGCTIPSSPYSPKFMTRT